MEYGKDISVVISIYDEEESLRELVGRIQTVMREQSWTYEIIMVDDGSRDGSWAVIRELAEADPCIRGISFGRNYGKSAALYCGFEAAEGRTVVTMDADLQDAPEEIPEMYRMLVEGGYDIVSGWKRRRKDNALTKNLPSKLYNATARLITGIRLHDMNCGLKIYRSEVIKSIEVYGDMHRYIPYLAKNAGFAKIAEKPVVHCRRKYGHSKFGPERFVNGFLDLMTLWFLSRFGKKPMHFFGFTGLLTFFIGFVLTLWVIIDKLVRQSHGTAFRAVTDRPLFYLALICLVIGVLLFLTGFLGELISRNGSERNHYNIRERF